jgi:hypothetical protein
LKDSTPFAFRAEEEAKQAAGKVRHMIYRNVDKLPLHYNSKNFDCLVINVI